MSIPRNSLVDHRADIISQLHIEQAFEAGHFFYRDLEKHFKNRCIGITFLQPKRLRKELKKKP